MDEQFIERTAFGMFSLEAPILLDHEEMWRSLDDKERSAWLAKARFVLSYAEGRRGQAG